jgi:hypothetical protein
MIYTFERTLKLLSVFNIVFFRLNILFSASQDGSVDAGGGFDTTANIGEKSRASSSSSGGRGSDGGDELRSSRTTDSSGEGETDRSSSSAPEKSAGKSAAVFIRSNDGRLLLKTLNEEERNQLLGGGDMLSMYYSHMEKYSSTTLLPWFLGCYTIYREGSSYAPVSVVMMSVSTMFCNFVSCVCTLVLTCGYSRVDTHVWILAYIFFLQFFFDLISFPFHVFNFPLGFFF